MILVTGATGLVGTHLLVRLVRENQPIRALYRSEAKKEHAKKVFSYYVENDENLFDTIDWIKTTINDVPTLSDVFIGVTHVYHCAAKISFNPSHYKELRKINIEGTANIVNLCILNKIKKLCHVSSIATLGKGTSNNHIDETATWNPEALNSVYAITKYGAEMEVWRGIQEGLDAVIVNPGIIIGPGFFDGGSGYLFKKIHEGMKFYTTGTTGYVAIHDVVNIMHQLMITHHSNERYILVGDHLDYKSAFSLIAEALGKPAPTTKASPLLLKFAYCFQSISHFLFRTKQSIFKSSIESAFSHSYYINDKIKDELNYSFTPIQKAIKDTATLFLGSM